MPAIDINDLRKIDLNLLPVFVALMRERNLTRVALQLNLGQPAVSATLKRLRETVGDPLFVRGPDGMTPTSRAIELLQNLEPALGAIRSAIRDEPAFDASRGERVFRLGMPDNHQHFLLPRLMEHLRRDAPNVNLVVRPTGWSDASAMLDSGEVELVCGYLPQLASWQQREPLAEIDFQCMFDRKRIGFTGALTLTRYLTLQHLLVSSRGDFDGVVDEALAALGKTRRVVLVTANFSALPPILKRIRAVATLPGYTARLYAREYKLEVCDPPLALRGYTSSLAWLRTRDDDPAHRWLREAVKSVVEEVAATA